jgi:hypothetical protein
MQFKWDRNEQIYEELKFKKKQQEAAKV